MVVVGIWGAVEVEVEMGGREGAWESFGVV